MKISLDTVGYAGYFYEGKPLTLEEAMARAPKFGYDGFYAQEQCSPIIMEGHKKATIEEVDRRYQETIKWARRAWADIDAGKL